MKYRLAALMLLSTPLVAQNNIPPTVHEDARVIRRIAQMSKRDFPSGLVARIVEEDMDLLRGKRTDGTYQFAHYAREEERRSTDRATIRDREKDDAPLDKATIKGDFVYRAIVSVPGRRMLLAKNRRVFIDRVEIDYTPLEGVRKAHTFPVQEWLQPGDEKRIDIPDIARTATVDVFARTEANKGNASLDLALLRSKVVDNQDSPYFSAVQLVKRLQRSAEREELKEVRTIAESLVNLAPVEIIPRIAEPISSVPVIPPNSSASGASELQPTPTVEIYLELQMIEDMLTGTEGERREGLDRLHQLVRKIRPGN